jgi:serine/threonine protein kinase
MVTEYCNGGELLDYITQNGKMDDGDAETVRVFVQIAEAVQKCHEKNFAHRDLKLENILLTDDLQVKLIDFGFTRLYDDKALLDTYCGSSAYCAPEIVAGQKYSGPEADIWSLGVVLYTIVCGYLPFDADTDADTHKQIKEINYEIPDFLREGIVELILKPLI